MTRATFTVTVEIDPATWSLNYGTDTADIPADVAHTFKELVGRTVHEYIASTGNTGTVTVTTK